MAKVIDPINYTMMTTIPTEEYKELLRKSIVYDLKKKELESEKFITRTDSVLFGVYKED